MADVGRASSSRPPASRRFRAWLRSTAKRAGTVLRRLGPFAVQLAVSGASYGVGIGLTQLIGFSLRVSSSTPLLSTLLGAAGVSASSIASGHVSRYTQRRISGTPAPTSPTTSPAPPGAKRKLARVLSRATRVALSPLWTGFSTQEALVDALVGLFLFKASGGRLNRLMPSNLRCPGALAIYSVPVSFASELDKGQLMSLLKRDGCHHCGSRRGQVVGDLFSQRKRVSAQGKTLPAVMMKIKTLMRSEAGDKKAVYFPQCSRCSSLQGRVLSGHKRAALVLHRWLLAPGLMPGLWVGFRQYIPSPSPSALPPAGSASEQPAPLLSPSFYAVPRGPLKPEPPSAPLLSSGSDVVGIPAEEDS